VANMLPMSTFQSSYPLALLIHLETTDLARQT